MQGTATTVPGLPKPIPRSLILSIKAQRSWPAPAARSPARWRSSRVLGYDEAKAGGTFLKIGVGILRKPDDSPYSHYRLYEIVDGGKWSVKKSADAVEFTQELHDASSGYGYVYRKK